MDMDMHMDMCKVKLWLTLPFRARPLAPCSRPTQPNEVEICRIADTHLPLPGGTTGDARTPEEALEALAAAYPRLLIVLTHGAAGEWNGTRWNI